MAGKQRTSPRIRRNYELAPGVPRFSAARMYSKRGVYSKKPFAVKKKPVEEKAKMTMKKVGGEKNAGERKPRFLPESRTALKCQTKNKSKAPSNLRKTITPGTVLIILTGRHKGKRAVFLKQLTKSGLLLVTGPMKLNSMPLRRVGQAFVIATKLKLNISGIKLPDHIDDGYFRRKQEKKAPRKGDADLFAAKSDGYTVSDQRKSDQKDLDGQMMAVIKKHPEHKALLGYLGSRFALGKNQYPHKMVF